MARIKTRGDLLARLKREGNVSTQSNSSDNARWREFLQDSWDVMWQELTNSDKGIGLTRRDFTLTVDGQTLPLPANFNRMQAVVINPGAERVVPILTSDKEVNRMALGETFPGNISSYDIYYQMEGPGEEYNELTDTYDEYPQRLRFWPDQPVGTVVNVSWVTQPKSLANTDGSYTDTTAPDQDTTISLDVIAEPVEGYLIATARMRSASRDDAQEYQRAVDSAKERLETFLSVRDDRNDASSFRPSRYIAQPRGRGRR